MCFPIAMNRWTPFAQWILGIESIEMKKKKNRKRIKFNRKQVFIRTFLSFSCISHSEKNGEQNKPKCNRNELFVWRFVHFQSNKMDFITHSIPFNAFSIHYAAVDLYAFALGISLIGDGVATTCAHNFSFVFVFIIILCVVHRTK